MEKMFVSGLCQVSGFFPFTPVSSTNKTDHHDIAEVLLKVELNTINQTIIIKSFLTFIFKNKDQFIQKKS
jgi:hypothetical protein